MMLCCGLRAHCTPARGNSQTGVSAHARNTGGGPVVPGHDDRRGKEALRLGDRCLGRDRAFEVLYTPNLGDHQS